MEKLFDINDQVRAINVKNTGLELNKIYTVERYKGGYIHLKESPSALGYFQQRFQLLTRGKRDNVAELNEQSTKSSIVKMEPTMNAKKANSAINWELPIETVGGVTAELITTTARSPNNQYPVMAYVGTSPIPSPFTIDGKSFTGEGMFDLRNIVAAEPDKPIETPVWFNVYRAQRGVRLIATGPFLTREKADEAGGSAEVERVSRIKLMLVEDQFDEE